MKKIMPLWIVFGLSMFLATAAGAEDIRQAIESQNRALSSAILQGGAEAVADLYTADAMLIPPGGEIANGRPAIVAFWRGAIDAGIKEVSLEIVSLEQAGEFAHEVGRVRIVDNAGQLAEDRYVVVWKREMGVWKLHRDIWNSAK